MARTKKRSNEKNDDQIISANKRQTKSSKLDHNNRYAIDVEKKKRQSKKQNEGLLISQNNSSSDVTQGIPDSVDSDGSKIDEGNTFIDIITKSGIKLGSEAENIVLEKEQNFVNKILLEQLKDDKIIKSFCDDFSNYIEDNNCFQMCLLPCEIKVNKCDEGINNSFTTSLIRILLEVQYLQTFILAIILEKLAETSDTIEKDGIHINFPKLVMNQMRWLGVVHDSETLMTKLMEIVSVTDDNIIIEIVAAIPEVIEDQHHSNVVEWLCDLLSEKTDLSITILDTLTSLTLDDEHLLKIRSVVVNQLTSIALEKLPVFVKFLLQTLSNKDCVQVIEDIRENLNLDTFSLSMSEDSAKLSNQDNTERCQLLIMMRAIGTSIQFKKIIADTWIKTIEATLSIEDIASLDIIILFVIYETDKKKYAHLIESLFRAKIRNGIFTKRLLQNTLTKHEQILREYFRAILNLCETLIKSNEPCIISFNSDLLHLLFFSVKDFGKQEIVGILVTHIGCGTATEIDTSLQILKMLIDTDIGDMIPYSVFIKGILDYLNQLTMLQFRKLNSILTRLAYNNLKPDKFLQDEMQMILRKQMSSNDPRFVRMGFIGAVGIIECLSNVSLDMTINSETRINNEIFDQVTSLLKLVQQRSKRTSDISSLLSDELANVIQRGHLNKKVMEWIATNVMTDFQDSFIVDIESDTLNTEISGLKLCLLNGLDSTEDTSVAVNIFPLVEKLHNRDEVDKYGNISPLSLAPHFRLLQMIEIRQNDGNLEEIDKLLGCPVLMISIEKLKNFTSLSQPQRTIICDCLIITLNWFRELINAFASQEEKDLQVKIVKRIINICELEKILATLLSVTRNFTHLNEVNDAKPIKKDGTGTSKSVNDNPKKKIKKKKVPTATLR